MFTRLAVRRACRIPRGQWVRLSSTTSESSGETSPVWRFRRAVATTTILVSGTLFAFYCFDSRSAIHRYIVTPVLRRTLDPETSHKVAVKALRSGLGPKDKGVDDERLRAEV